jgi:hypothetical protein
MDFPNSELVIDQEPNLSMINYSNKSNRKGIHDGA